MRCCAGFLVAVLSEANPDDRPRDVFGKLQADVRVTTQTSKRRAADALRILFVTRREFCQRRDLLVEHKDRRLSVHIFRVRRSCSSRAAPRYRPSGRFEPWGVPAQKEGHLKLIARQPRTRRRRWPRHCDRIGRLRGWVSGRWSGDASNDASEFWRKNIQDGRSVTEKGFR